jgi:hypothetical protein
MKRRTHAGRVLHRTTTTLGSTELPHNKQTRYRRGNGRRCFLFESALLGYIVTETQLTLRDARQHDETARPGLRTVKIGAYAVGGGMLWAICGGVVSESISIAVGNMIHKSGLTVALGGFLTMLVGYRQTQILWLLREVFQMQVQRVDAPPFAKPSRRTQFTLRGLFILMTLTAIWLVVVIAAPNWLASIALFYLNLVAVVALTIAAVYGREATRTFSIAALIPAVLLLLVSMLFYAGLILDGYRYLGSRQWRMYRLAIGLHWPAIVACGLFGRVMRRFVEPRQQECDPPGN